MGALHSRADYGDAVSDRRRTRLAAYVVALGDAGIVLSRIADGYPGAGSWTLPGGGVEWGEHPEDALRREVYEEAGFRLADPRFVGIDSRVYPRHGSHAAMHAIRLIYTADVEGTPEVTEVAGSVDASRWVALDGLAEIPTVDLVGVALDLLRDHRA